MRDLNVFYLFESLAGVTEKEIVLIKCANICSGNFSVNSALASCCWQNIFRFHKKKRLKRETLLFKDVRIFEATFFSFLLHESFMSNGLRVTNGGGEKINIANMQMNLSLEQNVEEFYHFLNFPLKNFCWMFFFVNMAKKCTLERFLFYF